MGNETYDVWQFFDDGGQERVQFRVSPEEAVQTAIHYATSVGARLGTTIRVLIVDQEDMTAWHWERDKGIVFPPEVEGRLKGGVR